MSEHYLHVWSPFAYSENIAWTAHYLRLKIRDLVCYKKTTDLLHCLKIVAFLLFYPQFLPLVNHYKCFKKFSQVSSVFFPECRIYLI